MSSYVEPETAEKITSYGYVVKSSSITVLDASIKMAFKLFEAHKKVHESEEKYRALFEKISDAIFTYDPETTHILDANKATSKMYGYDKDELIGMSCLKFSAEVEESVSTIDKIREDDEVNVPLRFHCKKDGTIFPVDISDHEITLSGENVMFAVSKDITESMMAVQKIRHESIMRENIFDNIPFIAMILEKGTRKIITSNKAARKIGAVPGKTCYETCAARDDNCPFCLATKLWVTNEPQDLEVEYIGKYYEGKWVLLSEDLYLHYIIDISEHKRHMELLKESEERFSVLYNSRDRR
jgi:PAS domain S-box-containing protein